MTNRKILSLILAVVLLFHASSLAFAEPVTKNNESAVTVTTEVKDMKFSANVPLTSTVVLETNKKAAVFTGTSDVNSPQVTGWIDKQKAELQAKMPGAAKIEISTRAGILDPRNMGNVSYSQAAERSQATMTTIGMVFSNSKLFINGFRDVWRATAQRSNGENLNDPAKRIEYWKQQGIYEKYNAKERAFINKVVFPAVAVARGAGVLAGGGAVAYGTAALLGLATAPALASGGAAVLAGAAVVAYNVHKLQKGANIANSTALKLGTHGINEAITFAGNAKWAGTLTGRIGLFRRAWVAGQILADRIVFGQSSKRILAGAGTTSRWLGKAVGANLALEGGLYAVTANVAGLTELARIWGIPEETVNVEVAANQKEEKEKDIPIKGTVSVKITK